MPSRADKKSHGKPASSELQTIPEQLFQLPSDLVWKRTFLDSRKADNLRSNSAPAALQTVPSHSSVTSASDSVSGETIAKSSVRESEKVEGEQDTRECLLFANAFGIGDTVAATSDFCIAGRLAVEKGCKGTVLCHGERPDGILGVSVEFETWKNGRAATVLCQPNEIEVVVKAPSAESFKVGEIVEVVSEFSIGGLVAVEKGCRGTVICHGEMPDGNAGVSVQFETRKDGRDSSILCRPHQIQHVRLPSHAWLTKYLDLARTSARAAGISLKRHLDGAKAKLRTSSSLTKSQGAWIKQSLDSARTRARLTMAFISSSSSQLSQFMFGNLPTPSFSLRSVACVSVAVVFVAISMCLFFLPSVPATEMVVVEDTEIYSRGVGGGHLNQCIPFTRNYMKIRSKKNITVCGVQTKVTLFLRNKCERYSYYQHEIGTCNETEASSTCITETPSSENAVRWHGQAQSFRVERCPNATGVWDEVWQQHTSKLHFASWQRLVPCFFAGSLYAKLNEAGAFETLMAYKRLAWRRVLLIFGFMANVQ